MLSLVGGKGANLGELVRANLPVPPSFCVTTDAYEMFVRDSGLNTVVAAQLEGADYEDVVDLTARAAEIRARFVAEPVPEAIEAAIRAGYAELERELGDRVRVSVRSSATAEDLPGMSFAGQQDTYLNVSGADSVVAHVKRCWASLWTDRAISYRHRQGFRHEDVLLAVVVQQMFASEVAGVMFTANPVTSNPGEIFINSSWGLGEAIVSGRVNPDQYIVDKASGAVTSKIINEKMIMTAPGHDGIGSEEVDVPEPLREAETLSAAQIAELCEIGSRIEAHYGFPQDIEWGFSDGRFAMLQAREVTAADIDFAYDLEAYQTPAARADLYDERWVWSRAYSDEVQTGPSSPYFYSVLEAGMTHLKHMLLEYTETKECLGYDASRFKDIPMYRWFGARAYYNLSIEKERVRRFIPPFARDDAQLWPFPVEEREKLRGMLFNWPRFIWILLKLHITRPNVSLIETPQVMFDNLPRWQENTEKFWRGFDYERASVRQIYEAEVKGRGDSAFGENVVLPFSIYLYVLPAALKTLCASWLNDRDGKISGALVSGLSTKTGEENIAIWKLASVIRSSAELTQIVLSETEPRAALARIGASASGADFIRQLDAFIVEYGHRGGAERDPIHPRYRHKPENVLIPIQAMLRMGEAGDPAVLEHELAGRMKETRERAIAKLGRGLFGFIKVPVFKWLLDVTQQYMYYRDFERFYNDKNMSRPRDFLTSIGRKFVERGLINDVEDVFFLAREEVLAADEGGLGARDAKNRIRARRRVYERYTGREPPKYVQGWRTFDDLQLPDDGKGLRGIGASSGTVSGRARVCRRLDEIGKVEKGDILITVATDPGWTTVFSIIGGVVVETGGVVAHAVMISREYGLPCVANLPKACDLIPDGARITVDGTNGRVIIHDDG
jgi:pyruvate,water dikinase